MDLVSLCQRLEFFKHLTNFYETWFEHFVITFKQVCPTISNNTVETRNAMWERYQRHFMALK